MSTLNPQQKRHVTALKKLARLLRKPKTARELAQAMGCATPTIYLRLEALRDQGMKIETTASQDPGRSGPVATLYSTC